MGDKFVEIFDKRIVLKPNALVSDMLNDALDAIDSGYTVSIDTAPDGSVVMHKKYELPRESSD